MSYVVFNTESTVYLRSHIGVKTNISHFATRSAASAALTREIRNTKGSSHPILREHFSILPVAEFDKIEKKVQVKNIMSDKMTEERANTPHCCSVGSEAYWSM